jgi:CubicO group peptidase (beta-lactamase class C family)
MTDPILAAAQDPAALAQRLTVLPWIAGVAVAGVVGDRIETAAAGVADAESGRVVEPDTRFRPGSITKLLTATLVMQCVDEGVIDLDEPVVELVPELRLADPDRASLVTVRHLLSHSSGIDGGDLFVDTGDGDDCRARYVEALDGAGFLFDPGTTFSYCNAGTILAGRVVEVVRDRTWEDALRERVFEPLGMTSSGFVAGPDAGSPEAMDGAARGHRIVGGSVEPLPWASDETYTTRATAPAGGTLVSTAGDLALLAASHMGSPSVPPVVSPPSAELMRELAALAPGGVAQMRGVGLGWQVWHRSVRAAGANPGQSGVIAVAEDLGSALVALTNSDLGVNAVTSAIDPGKPPPVGAEPPLPLERYAGEYASHAGVVTITAKDDGLSATLTGYEEAAMLAPVDATTFSSPLGPLAFFAPDDDGRPQLVRARMRVMRRIS